MGNFELACYPSQSAIYSLLFDFRYELLETYVNNHTNVSRNNLSLDFPLFMSYGRHMKEFTEEARIPRPLFSENLNSREIRFCCGLLQE